MGWLKGDVESCTLSLFSLCHQKIEYYDSLGLRNRDCMKVRRERERERREENGDREGLREREFIICIKFLEVEITCNEVF